MNCSLPGSSIHVIFQARVLEWGALHVCVLSHFSPVDFCNAVDCSPPGSSAKGILQARIIEWVTIPPSGDLPDPGIEPVFLLSPALAGEFFTISAILEA